MYMLFEAKQSLTGVMQAVHKELEREIGFEELKVDITSDEERWALR